jgi:hypothetical protein
MLCSPHGIDHDIEAAHTDERVAWPEDPRKGERSIFSFRRSGVPLIKRTACERCVQREMQRQCRARASHDVLCKGPMAKTLCKSVPTVPGVPNRHCGTVGQRLTPRAKALASIAKRILSTVPDRVGRGTPVPRPSPRVDGASVMSDGEIHLHHQLVTVADAERVAQGHSGDDLELLLGILGDHGHDDGAGDGAPGRVLPRQCP